MPILIYGATAPLKAHMNIVTAYKTIDGKLFATKEEASDYEQGEFLTVMLDKFSSLEACPYPDGVANAQMRKSIIAWEIARHSVVIDSSIDDLLLTVRSTHCLKAEKIETVSQLLKLSANMLLKTPNLGRKSLDEIVMALRLRGLKLAD